MTVKPYHQVSIQECGEPLVPIPTKLFSFVSPHPYQKLGAPYGEHSPYLLRTGVVSALILAQKQLREDYPALGLQIFDGFRPVAVQQFMVDYTFEQVLHSQQVRVDSLDAAAICAIWEQVYEIWAVPHQDPATPPPHTTGAAVDLTLVDALGVAVDLGGEIDEMSARSRPLYYADSNDPQHQGYHRDREYLNQIMSQAGFIRHPGEWWHFSLGDQMWAWQKQQQDPIQSWSAYYGRIDP